MACADCERINQEILRKAKEVADALLGLFDRSDYPRDPTASIPPFRMPTKPPDDAALQQDGGAQ